jgi:hypothetical protein
MRKWAVTSNVIIGETIYAVYRRKYLNEPDHSGNREYATKYINNRRVCQAVADKLNNDQENIRRPYSEGLSLEEWRWARSLVHDFRAEGIK